MFSFAVLVMIRIFLLVMTSFQILHLRFRKKQVFSFHRFIAVSDNSIRSSFPRSLLSVKDGISLLLVIVPSSLLNSSFMLGVVRIK